MCLSLLSQPLPIYFNQTFMINPYKYHSQIALSVITIINTLISSLYDSHTNIYSHIFIYKYKRLRLILDERVPYV